MENITVFKTKDGKLFEDQNKATLHEQELDFDEWYLGNELLGNYAGSRVELEDLKQYISKNAGKLKFLLEA